MAVITISRQSGSMGREIAEQLSTKLNIPLITRKQFLSQTLSDVLSSQELSMLEQSPKFYLNTSNEGITYKELIEKRLLDEASKGPCVILGMSAQIIFSDSPDAINIRVIASHETRLKRFGYKYGQKGDDAEKLIKQTDRRHKKFISVLYDADSADPLLYDMVLNTDTMTVDQCVELIAYNINLKDSMKFFSFFDQDNKENSTSSKKPVFKHPAEEEFANILNMYGIAWEYEPKTFPVKWDAEGNVTMAISPDFYLTKFDTYIEITTMEQKYVTTKNKKVKLMRALYPGVNVNIVYKKDFYSLLERFGFSGGEEINEFNRS
ncbi:MAG: cytidylate kinase-like family protein [Clostridiaceae bacterium]|nr:cytidylate kinase-like family protein [Clostridiaceae bacterium]